MPAIVWASADAIVFRFTLWTHILTTVLVGVPFVTLSMWKGVESIQ